MTSSIEVLFAITISSLAGSLHCVGMCGGLLSLCCVSSTEHPSSKRLLLPELAYHLMRLVSYMTLGAFAGSIGSFGSQISEAAGFQRGFGIFAGGVLVFWGLRELGLFSLLFRNLRSTSQLQSALSIKFISLSIFKYPLKLKGVARGAFIGLMSGLLPCGWLYAYVIGASTTQDPLSGALFMAAFWIGTVPALFLFARVIKKINSWWLSKIPKMTAVFIILLGIMSIAGKIENIIPLDGKQEFKGIPYCH